jgi:hypothetical protein
MEMGLDSVTIQGVMKPPRLVIHGPQKIGKSSFAASAPKAIFIPIEDGLDNIKVSAFPLVKTYAQAKACLASLYEETHDYQTVVVDSMDWLEKLIWKQACNDAGKDNIEDFGYGKGYVAALDIWKEFLDGLNALRLDKHMTVICICHTEIKRFDAPDSDPYDRYIPKLHNRATALVSEWADIIGFANYKVVTKIVDTKFNEKKHRGISTGERLLFLEEKPAFIAGNRYGLPASIGLDWTELTNSFNDSKGE